MQIAGKVTSHGRVIPGAIGVSYIAGQKLTKQLALNDRCLLVRRSLWEFGDNDCQQVFTLADVQAGRCDVPKLWFFPENHTPGAGKAAEKMLGPLVDEVPPQVGKHK